VPVALKRTLTGEGPTITIDMADDLAVDTPERVELRLLLKEWVKGDVMRVFWDGAELLDPETRYMSDRWTQISDVSGAAWLHFRLAPDRTGVGPHAVKVVLAERVPKMASDIVLTDVEVVIRYHGA
jgi:hypothetical protein